MFGNKVIQEPEPDIVLRRGEMHEPVEWAELLPVAVAACVCGHPVDDHDFVARRYCAATIAAVLPRGCICGAPPADRRR
jgi:hypothetical protein